MNQKSPSHTFSIIIPTLNEQDYLPKLLDDLSNQTFQDFEVIIVDGQSEDGTVNLAKSYQGQLSGLKVINSTKRNVCSQRNQGAQKARAPWLLFMDADNRLPSFYLQGLKYRVELNDPDLFVTFIKPDSDNLTDQAIASVANMYMDLQKNTTKPSILEAMVGFKAPVFQDLKGFDQSIKFAEGAYIGAKAIKAGYKFMVFKDPAYHYSMRRFHKLKTVKTAQAAASLEVARLLNIKISPKTVEKLYPMEGGKLKKAPHFLDIFLQEIKQEIQKDKQFSKFKAVQKRLKLQLEKLLD